MPIWDLFGYLNFWLFGSSALDYGMFRCKKKYVKARCSVLSRSRVGIHVLLEFRR